MYLEDEQVNQLRSSTVGKSLGRDPHATAYKRLVAELNALQGTAVTDFNWHISPDIKLLKIEVVFSNARAHQHLNAIVNHINDNGTDPNIPLAVLTARLESKDECIESPVDTWVLVISTFGLGLQHLLNALENALEAK